MENSHHREEEKMMRSLYEASYKGCVSTLNSLIQQDPLILNRINSRTTFTETPLHISASLGHLPFIQALLTHKPKLALELDSFRSTALHLASAEGHTEIVKKLLEACEEACLICDQEGRIPLHIAVIRGRKEVITELIRVKPESLRILHKGKSTFHLCVAYNHLEILKALIELGHSYTYAELLNLQDLDGNNTILHLAIMLKQVETVRYLVSIPKIREASNLKNDMGFTATDIVCRIPKDFKIFEIQVILMNSGFTSENKEPNIPQAQTTTDAIVEEVRPAKKCWGNLLKWMGQGFNHNGEWLEEMRGNLSLVATVISTITFQAVINPPGGFIQQGLSNSNNTSGPLDCLNNDNYGPCPGKFLLAANDMPDFHYFMAYNTTAFLASLGVALLLVSGLPLKNKVVMWMLSLGMCVTLTTLALAYFSAYFMMIPDMWDSMDKTFYIARGTWMALLALAGAYISLAFINWLVKKCIELIKHNGCQCVQGTNHETIVGV